MAVMYEPQGEIWLGKVPWDTTYRNVWHTGMTDKAQIVSQFCDKHLTGFSWAPKNNVIRVPENANDYIGYNYCVYRNNGMLFCAFVTDVEYMANQTTALHLQEDVWHTWGGSMVLKRCMVARHHVRSDNLGQWRAPEPAMQLESVVLHNALLSDANRDLIVIGTTEIPHLKAGVTGDVFTAHPETDFDGADAVAGGLQGGMYSGAKYYGFSFEGAAQATNFVDNLNKCGAGEAICAMFLVSSRLFSLNARHEVTKRDVELTAGTTAPMNHGGDYHPRNNKCFTYPYAFAQFSDLSGAVLDVKYEDCDTWGVAGGRVDCPLDPTAPTVLYLKNYQGNAVDRTHMINIDQAPQCAWVYSAYQNWQAQTASQQSMKMALNVGAVLSGVAMTAIGAALFATGAGAPAGGALAGTGLGLTTAEVAGAGMALSGVKAGIGGALRETERLAALDYQQKQPNLLTGSLSGNTLQGLAMNRGCVANIGLEYQSAQRLDWFFDVFGYQIDMVTLPNLTGRPSWNYVKTVGANMGGDIPADRLAVMNACLDSGITFWHNADVGNYSLNNTLS